MTKTLLSVASVGILITSVVHGANITRVNAKSDAQIHLYPFNTVDCTETPVGSPLELKEGECVNFHGAHSVKPRYRVDHRGWVDDVNELETQCKLETFYASGCPDSSKTIQYLHGRSGDMPKDLEHCLVGYHSLDNDDRLHEHILYSARFFCDKLEKPELLCTSRIEHTSWSLDTTGEPHSAVHTAVYTGTLSANDNVARSVHVEETKPTLVPRFKPGRETKSVWMLHPWSKSLVCYLCYPKKEGNYGKIECRAGIGYPAQCGQTPADGDGQPVTPSTTTTAISTATTTTHTTRTAVTAFSRVNDGDAGILESSSDSESDFPHLDLELTQKKSWHTPVKFAHPFVPGKYLCADAEWEKRGRPESYIKIQRCHICDHKDRADSLWIGLPETAVYTTSKTTTTTDTIRHTISRRHDQL